MGGWTGIWQWVVVLVIAMLLFGGRGKLSMLMGDLGKGLKSFKKNLKDDDQSAPVVEAEPKALHSNTVAPESEPRKDQSTSSNG